MMPSARQRTSLILGSLAALAAPLTAQTNAQLWRWVDAQAGFCVWYLADPAIAPELVPAGTPLRPASATASIPEVLLRVVQDEPRFAEWIPAMLCVGRYVAVAADGVPAGTMADDGQPMLFTLSAFAAASPYGQDAGWQLSSLGLAAGRLNRVASEAGIGRTSARLRDRAGLEGEDTQWELVLDGAKLIWNGHPTGEPRVGTTQMMSFGYAGERGTMWLMELRAAPAVEQGQVGALRIEGRHPLAQALKSSPIRAAGPLAGGGELTMSFRRLEAVRQ